MDGQIKIVFVGGITLDDKAKLERIHTFGYNQEGIEKEFISPKLFKKIKESDLVIGSLKKCDPKHYPLLNLLNERNYLSVKDSPPSDEASMMSTHKRYRINNQKISVFTCSDRIDPKKVLNFIERLKSQEQPDKLIMSIFWKQGLTNGLTKRYDKFIDSVLSAGVDVIYGSTQDKIHCVDQRGEKIIIYGCGDFITSASNSRIGMLFELWSGKLNIQTIKMDNGYTTLQSKR